MKINYYSEKECSFKKGLTSYEIGKVKNMRYDEYRNLFFLKSYAIIFP